jgi:hypothetical protein
MSESVGLGLGLDERPAIFGARQEALVDRAFNQRQRGLDRCAESSLVMAMEFVADDFTLTVQCDRLVIR